MPLYGEVIVGVCIAVGLLGIVVPVLPGTLLVAVSILVWAIIGGFYIAAIYVPVYNFLHSRTEHREAGARPTPAFTHR